jgi:hypothetical protein
MSLFGKREQGFEEKFAHDEELRFKAHVRRDKLVGLWAAGLLGLSGAEAEKYADSLVRQDLKTPGDADIIKKLRADFDAKGVKVSDHQIHRALEENLAKAVAEIEAGR